MNLDDLKRATLCAIKSHASCELGGEAVIMQTETGTYFTLNSVGARIWEIVQQPCTFESVVSLIIEEYDVDRSQAEVDIDALLRSMLAEGLIQVCDESSSNTQ